MPDLKQALKDFVATSNSGKYKSESELLSKFPELKGYDSQSLKDYVATSNSGKYKSEDELNSKFPELFAEKKNQNGTAITQKKSGESVQTIGSSGTAKQKFRLPNDSDVIEMQKQGKLPKVPVYFKTKFNEKELYDLDAKGNIILPSDKQVKKNEDSIIESNKIAGRDSRRATDLELNNFKNSTSLTPQEIEEKKKEVDDEINKNGFWNTAKDYGKKALNVLSSSVARMTDEEGLDKELHISTDPLSDYKQEFINKQKENGVDTSKLSKEDVFSGAKNLLIKDKKDKLKEDKTSLYIDSLSDEEKNALKLTKLFKRENLNEKDKVYLANTEISKQEIENTNSEIKRIVDKFNKKEDLSESEVEFAKNYEKNAKKLAKEYDENYIKYQKNNSELGDVAQEYDLLKRDYDITRKSLATIGGRSAQILYGLATVSNDILNPYEESRIAINDKLAEANSKVNDLLENNFQKNTDGWNGVGDAFEYVVDVISNQLPNLALMTATGGSSQIAPLLTIGAYSTGNKINDLTQSNNEGKTFFTEDEIRKYAYVAGAGEMLETGTMGNLVRFNKFMKASFNNPQTRELFLKTTKESLANSFKLVGKGLVSENAEELGTMWIDIIAKEKFLGVKTSKKEIADLTERTLKDTSTMSLLMSGAPQIAHQVMKAITPKSYVKKLDENTKEILRLSGELKKTNLTKEESDIIKKSLDNKISENKKMLENVLDRNKNLDDEQRKKAIDLELSTSQIRNEATSIKKSTTIDKDVKIKLLKDLEVEYKKQEALRENIASGTASILDIVSEDKKEKMKSEALKTLLKENPNTHGANFTNDVIEKKAIEIYNKEKQTKSIIDAEVKIPTTKTEPQTEIQESESQPQAEVEKTEQESVSAENAEPIQESTAVENSEINPEAKKEYDAKKAEIEKNREKGLAENKLIEDGVIKPAFEMLSKEEINAKYDAQLESLNKEYDKLITPLLENEVSDTEYSDFIDKGIVSDDRLNSIANKVKNQEKLSEKETAIFNDKTSEINNILKNESTSPSNTSTNGNVQSGNESVEQMGIKEKPTTEIASKESVQPANDVKPIEGEAKVKVYRGEPKNVSNPNKNISWVTPNKELAEEYSYDLGLGKNGTNEKGNVSEIEITIPKNPLILNYKGDTDVRGSDIAGGLRQQLKEVYKAKKITNEKAKEISEKISKYEELAGNNLEPWHTKVNKESVTEIFVEIAKDLGFDGIKTNEGRNGEFVGYGLFKPTEEKTQVDYALDQIEKGVLQWNGDINSPRIDLGMSWADIRKGEADLKRGKIDSVPAKRLLEAFNKAKEEGGYHYKLGTGGANMRSKEFVSFEDMQRATNENNFTDAEIEEINQNEEQLVQEYYNSFDKLTEEEQNEILENYEGKTNEQTKVGENTESGNSKNDVSNEEETARNFKREKGKSSVLKRIREGGNSEEINKIIDKIGLNYEGRKQEQVYADGVNFVKEVGVAEAYNAIKSGELKDSDTINVVYATILQEFSKMVENEISKVSDPQELSELMNELDDLHIKIYSEFKARTIDVGRGSAILNFIYNQELKIKYSLSQQIENFKKVNNGVIPEEVLAKIKELDKKYQEANKRVEELESLLKEAQEQKDFENIVEEEKRNGDFKYTQEDFDKELQKSIDNIKNDIKNEKKSLANKKREDVLTPKEKSRKQELRNKYFRANDITSIPALLVDPEFREYLGLVLKQAKGDFKIFSKEMLDTLGKVAKTHLPDLFKEAQNESSKKIGKLTVDEGDNISIPNSLIRSLVEQGFDDIKKLTSKILSDYKDEFPDLTERKIRDAITKYGKTVEPNNVDPAPLIRKIKRAGKAISAIEDIAEGIRPKRSGLQRDKLDPEERRILRDINESMKNLPLDKADLSKHLKTALDAIKTRLSNHIEDLNKQIAEGKKWSKDKSSVELDQDAKDLVAKRDSLKIALDELVNVPKTEDEIYNERIASKLAEREKVLQGLIEGKKNDPTGRKSDWSAEISKVNTEISRLREKQKAIKSQKTPDEIYQKEVEAKINSLQKRIDDVKTGKVKDTEGNSSVWNNEISELETELKNLKEGKKVVNEPKVTVKNGKVKIPTEMIKDFILKGGTDLSEFAKQVKESIKDEFPDVSVRDIRESVANYGKKVNKSRPQIIEDIQKLKLEEKLRLEYEDLQNRISKEKNEVKKRALSQTERRLKTQIKQLQNDLGITESERTNRSVNYTKKRIEILKEKIKNNDFSKKEIKPIVESKELRDAKIKKNRIQEEFDYLIYEQEIKNRTFGDKAKEFAKDIYDSQRVTLATGEMSFVGAQGGFYMVDSTFSRKTLENLIKNFKGTTSKEWRANPFGTALKMIKSAHSAESIMKMFSTMGTANNYLDFQRMLKEDVNYDLYLKSGLRILGEDVKSQVKDDNFIGNNILTLLKIPIHLIDRIEKQELKKLKLSFAETEKKRTTLQGFYEKLKTGKISDKNKKTATEIFSNANPLSTFERGNTVFMNMARIEMFNKYASGLYASGKNPIDHLSDFKKLGSAINTITGSGNMSQTVTMALPVLNKVMFSARYFASSWNLTPPFSLYYLAKLGNYDGVEINSPSTWKNLKPTVAQKAFVKPMIKGFVAFYGLSLMTMAMINASIDDDDEMPEEEKKKKRAYIEYDPRSSNFMQVISGSVRTDYFGPYRGNVVLLSKLLTGQSKNKKGEIVENGADYGSRTDFQIGTEYLAGKANPFPGMFIRYSQGKKEDVLNLETGKVEEKRMLFDKEIGIGYQMKNNVLPIFVTTVKDITNEDPVLGATFYNSLALFGKQSSVYKDSDNFENKQAKLAKEYILERQKPLETITQETAQSAIKSAEGDIVKFEEFIKVQKKNPSTPYYISKDIRWTSKDLSIEDARQAISDIKEAVKEARIKYNVK